MANIHRFLRSISPEDMRLHFEQSGIPEPANMNWGAAPEEFCKGFLKAVDTLSDQARIQLFADIDRISDMSDEVGQAALMALVDWRERLCAIEGAHRRAHWLYVQSKEAFRQSEEIRYADENQNAQRMWDGFLGPRLVDLKTDDTSLAEFRAELAKQLGADRVHVEIFGRVRYREGEPNREIKQVTIYSEDVPEDEIVFSGTGVRNQARKPVRETAIIYEPASGTIEVVGRARKMREKIAAEFAKKMLGVAISGEKLPPRRVDLTPLLYSDQLSCEPTVGVARIKLTMLALSTLDGRLKQKFEVPFSDSESLHAALASEFGTRNPLSAQIRLWMARIEVQFEPEAGRRMGKKINITLCTPNKCNLRGKTEKERLFLNRYLREWGLLRGADE